MICFPALVGGLVADRRICVNVNGQVRPPLLPQPILSSVATMWEGFVVEQHYFPPLVEFPANMSFPGHVLAVTLCHEPPVTYWRENGRERNARLFNGRVSMNSSEELIAARQQGASMVHAVMIHDSTMERVCEEVPGRRQIELSPRPDVEDDALRYLIMAISEDLKAGCPTGRIFGESIANTIAAYAARRYATSSCRFHEYRDGLPALCLRRVLDYIEANLDRDLGVSEISHIALISPYYFGKLFKRSAGQTLHQYVLDQRIRKAQALLATSNITLVEIASTVGLANQSHFTTAFKKKLGVTPGYYRSRVRGQSQ